MSLAISSEKELEKVIKESMEKSIVECGNVIKELITAFITDYYFEYQPEYYDPRIGDRTYQFLNSCMCSDYYWKGDTCCMNIYINYQDLHYRLDNPYKVIEWANAGTHGGYTNVQLGVSRPFSHFWDDAMEALNENKTNVVEDFIKYIKEIIGCDVEVT